MSSFPHSSPNARSSAASLGAPPSRSARLRLLMGPSRCSTAYASCTNCELFSFFPSCLGLRSPVSAKKNGKLCAEISRLASPNMRASNAERCRSMRTINSRPACARGSLKAWFSSGSRSPPPVKAAMKVGATIAARTGYTRHMPTESIHSTARSRVCSPSPLASHLLRRCCCSSCSFMISVSPVPSNPSQIRLNAFWMSFREYLSTTGRPCGQQKGMEVWESSVSIHCIFAASSGMFTLIAAWQAMEAAISPRTFMAAFTGGGDRLPEENQAFKDPRAQAGRELIVRMLRQRSAFEARMFGEANLLISAQSFPFFFALTGDRNPKQEGKNEKSSQLVQDAYAVLQREGPISKRNLAERLGGAPSEAALDRALGELWGKLLIMRVDYRPGEGAYWDVLYRWAPEAV